MTYELAKQLKDAGFPIYNNPCFRCVPQFWEDDEQTKMVNCPTLSELIEACGEVNLVIWRWYGPVWFASKQPTQHWLEMEAQAEGKTPKKQ